MKNHILSLTTIIILSSLSHVLGADCPGVGVDRECEGKPQYSSCGGGKVCVPTRSGCMCGDPAFSSRLCQSGIGSGACGGKSIGDSCKENGGTGICIFGSNGVCFCGVGCYGSIVLPRPDDTLPIPKPVTSTAE